MTITEAAKRIQQLENEQKQILRERNKAQRALHQAQEIVCREHDTIVKKAAAVRDQKLEELQELFDQSEAENRERLGVISAEVYGMKRILETLLA